MNVNYMVEFIDENESDDYVMTEFSKTLWNTHLPL